MTLEKDMTSEELIRKARSLKNHGPVRTATKGPTGVGDTLEQLMGLPRTKYSLPDWGPIELKAHRKGSGSRMTLISLQPTILHGKNRTDIIREHGIESNTPGRLNLYNTMSGNKENMRGWKIDIDVLGDTLSVQKYDVVIASTKISDLSRKLVSKAKNLLLVYARSEKKMNTEFFEFYQATLYHNMRVGLIPDLLRTGDMVFEWRMHLKPEGTVRDHGPAYRIAPKNLHMIYEKTERLY